MSILTARILQCVFPGSSQTYAYFTDDVSIKEGDLVVVGTPRASQGETFKIPSEEADKLEQRHAKIVQVVSTEETVDSVEKVREWIIGKLDFATYNSRRNSEKKRQVILAKIRRAKEEALQNMDFDALKAMSPELNKLVGDLLALNKQG